VGGPAACFVLHFFHLLLSHRGSSGMVLIGAILHLSNEPGELSQWLCHDDSTINIVLAIIIIGVDQHYQSIETVCLIHISKVIKRVI